MAKPVSQDLRDRVIDCVLAGFSCAGAGDRFGVSESSAIKWTRRFRKTGLRTPKPMGGDRRSKHIEAHRDEILEAIELEPDITLAAVQSKLKQASASFSISAIDRFMVRHKLTFKKRQRMLQNVNART